MDGAPQLVRSHDALVRLRIRIGGRWSTKASTVRPDRGDGASNRVKLPREAQPTSSLIGCTPASTRNWGRPVRSVTVTLFTSRPNA